MAKTDGLIRHLRKWGLKVQEKDGWRQRGRPYSFRPRAIMVHHTASGSQSGNFASEGIVTFGRSDLPGPLCQFLLGRDGTVKIIAGGYANHAGYGGPEAGVPANQGNTYSYGIEAENNGIGENWSKKQLNAYYRLCAALLDWMNTKDVNKVMGHKEWTSRKIDPAGVNMKYFRNQVERALKDGPSVKTVRASRVKPGKRNKDVLAVKRRLRKRGYFTGANTTNFYGSGMANSIAKFQRDIGYSRKEADGAADWKTLRKLGFRVVK